jgi:hypothetical protein
MTSETEIKWRFHLTSSHVFLVVFYDGRELKMNDSLAYNILTFIPNFMKIYHLSQNFKY